MVLWWCLSLSLSLSLSMQRLSLTATPHAVAINSGEQPEANQVELTDLFVIWGLGGGEEKNNIIHDYSAKHQSKLLSVFFR